MESAQKSGGGGGGGGGGDGNTKAEKKFGVNEKVVLDWRKKKEVLQSMPKMRKTMIVRREPQWPELEQRLYDWENPEIPTNNIP